MLIEEITKNTHKDTQTNHIQTCLVSCNDDDDDGDDNHNFERLDFSLERSKEYDSAGSSVGQEDEY